MKQKINSQVMLASRMRAQVEQAFGSESHRELNLPMTNYVNRIAI